MGNNSRIIKESLRYDGTTNLDLSKPGQWDSEKNTVGMTVFVPIDGDGICTFLLSVFWDYRQYLAISSCHLPN